MYMYIVHIQNTCTGVNLYSYMYISYDLTFLATSSSMPYEYVWEIRVHVYHKHVN